MTGRIATGARTALALTVILVAWSAMAQPPDAACRAEIEKACPGKKPGDGEYGQCVIDHKGDLSAPCKKYADAAAARKADLKNFPACIADAEKLCPGLKVSLTKLTKCLRTHQGDISPECRTELGQRSGKYH